jgi:ATP-dependent protease ClpP protease subunit
MAKIKIVGHIGPSSVDQAGKLHKGVELLDVIEQVESFPTDLELEIEINSPGGYADVGDSIFEYLNSQKAKGKKLTTVQTGLIGSIATKIFLVGDRRIVDDRYQFWIHNPYMDGVSGDQDALREMASSLQKTETELRKFYSEFTNISDEGLDSLMKIETGLTADQCVKFGFATDKKLIPVFNSIKNKMGKFEEKVNSFLGREKKKGVQPKAQVPENKTKTMVVVLADEAGSFWVEGELAEGSSAFLLDENGEPTVEPVADGMYMLEDGTSLEVAGGLLSSVLAAEAKTEEGPAPMISPEQLSEMIAQEVSKALALRDEEQAKLVADKITEVKKEVEEKAEARILNLKKDIKLGIQPIKAVLQNTEEEPKRKTIHSIMAEKREKRKQQLNGK